MKRTAIVRPEAEADLSSALAWYEEKRKGLGYDFVLQVDAGIRFIERNAEIHPSDYKGARSHLIKRFPYRIIYFTEEERVIILGILHGKRSPRVAEKRKTDI